jgi:DNA-binding CsgD family transcriptional regulator
VSISGVVGRGDELPRIDAALEGAKRGLRILLIQGDAGIGKSTLWNAGVRFAEARGYRILQAGAVDVETMLPFTTLSDLLDPVLDDESLQLPAPRRRALDVALLRAASEEPLEPRAVSLATLEMLRLSAAERSVLVAIDDLQWVDASSARVLGFCLRRLRESHVVLLASVRTRTKIPEGMGLGALLSEVNAERLNVGPLAPESIGRIIRQHLRLEVPHPTILRIHGRSAGNPLYALEIARGLAERGAQAETWELPLPRDLRGLLLERLTALPASARGAVMTASAINRPTVELVFATGGEHAMEGMRTAERAGVIEIDAGLIRFTHPLLGSAAYGSMSEPERRALHARLAEVIDDPEEQVRHRALAAAGPNEAMAAALDEAARRAWLRGAGDAASDLVALARTLTPAGDAQAHWRRGRTVALYSFAFGDVRAARAMFQELVDTSSPGPMRARSLRGLALAMYAGDRVGALLRQALEEARDDDRLVAMIRADLAWEAIFAGDLVLAEQHARMALDAAERPRVPARRERALSGEEDLDNAWAAAEALRDALMVSAMVEALAGRPARELRARAVALDVPGERFASVLYASTPYSALLSMWAGEIDTAREELLGVHAITRERGWQTVRGEQVAYLSELESRAGNWDLARSYALEAEEIISEASLDEARSVVLFPKALVEALQGDTDAARTDATEGIELAEQIGERYSAIQNRMALGFTELSCGDHGAALAAVEVLPDQLARMGVREPGAFPFVPDAVEALVALGDAERADRLIDTLEEQGRALDRPLALATAARCRGLVAAARGDRDRALEGFATAVAQHARIPQPFELGRTLLTLGEVQRRFKRRGDARASLQGALAIFDELGAVLWSARAAAELGRVGVSADAPAGLTPTELRVAQLAAQGKTNREIAAALFISVKTVEANLSRVFHKLGIRSRRQIAPQLEALGRG